MYVITRVYDDAWADIIDISTMIRSKKTKAQLLKMDDKHVIGLGIYNNEIVQLIPYEIISFPTEVEALEYCGYKHEEIMYVSGYYWIFIRKNEIIHVDYLVYSVAGEEYSYVTNSGYSPYIQSAKCFNRDEAYKKANTMTKNSKTGKHWSVQRVERN